jgi:hypothetical protein
MGAFSLPRCFRRLLKGRRGAVDWRVMALRGIAVLHGAVIAVSIW